MSPRDVEEASLLLPAPPPPRSWKWVFVTPVSVLIALLSLGNVYIISVFSHPIHHLHPSWGWHIIPRTLAVQGACCGLMPTFIGGSITNGLGPRFWAMVSALLMAVGQALSGVAIRYGEEWLWYTAKGVEGLGFGTLLLTVVVHAMHWFRPKCGLIASVVGGSVGLSAVMWSVVDTRLLDTIGVEHTLYVHTGCSIAILPFAFFFSLPPPEAVSTSNDAQRAPPRTQLQLLRERQIWTVAAVVVAGLMPGWGLVSSYVAVFHKVGDVDLHHARQCTSVVCAFYTVGRSLGGTVGDFFGAKRTIVGCLLLEMLSLLLMGFVLFHNIWLFVGATCVFVMCYGAVKVLVSPLTMEIFGPADQSSALGMLFAPVTVAMIVGPLLISHIPSLFQFNPYAMYFLVCTCVLALATLLLVTVNPPAAGGDKKQAKEVNGEPDESVRSSKLVE